MSWTYCEWCDASLQQKDMFTHTCPEMPADLQDILREIKEDQLSKPATIRFEEFERMQGERNLWRNVVRDAIGCEPGDPDPDPDEARRRLITWRRTLVG